MDVRDTYVYLSAYSSSACLAEMGTIAAVVARLSFLAEMGAAATNATVAVAARRKERTFIAAAWGCWLYAVRDGMVDFGVFFRAVSEDEMEDRNLWGKGSFIYLSSDHGARRRSPPLYGTVC